MASVWVKKLIHWRATVSRLHLLPISFSYSQPTCEACWTLLGTLNVTHTKLRSLNIVKLTYLHLAIQTHELKWTGKKLGALRRARNVQRTQRRRRLCDSRANKRSGFDTFVQRRRERAYRCLRPQKLCCDISHTLRKQGRVAFRGN